MQILFSEKGQIFLSFELASTSINATGAWSQITNNHDAW